MYEEILSESVFTAKKPNDTFLYTKGNYERPLFEFLMKAERVNKSDESFEEIRYEIKKQQVTSTLTKVLDSTNVELLISDTPLPRAFKVFVAKDPKSNNKKAFIDVSELIKSTSTGTGYTIDRRNVIILISYLTSAMNSLIYNSDPQRVVGNSTIIKYGTICFSKFFYYIIDYLRLGGIDNIKEVCMYLSAMYFQVNIMGKDINDSVLSKAKTISGIADLDISKLNYIIGQVEDPFENIDVFIKSLAMVLKAESKLTIDSFINTWMRLFGSGTQFSTELYTSFSDMMINVYVGTYLNQQNTIEKVAGVDLVEFVKGIFKIGSDSI